MIFQALTFPLRLALHYWVQSRPIDWAEKYPARLTVSSDWLDEERAA